MSSSERAKVAHQSFDALKNELEAIMANIRDKRAALEERSKSLAKRRGAIFDCNGDDDIHQGSRKKQEVTDCTDVTDKDKDKNQDIIKLNVGGTKMYVSRETLTSVKDSRLYFLFNGKIDNKLLRDQDGCIFLDVNPLYFQKILEYLYEFGNPTSTKGCPCFDMYLEFFGLQKPQGQTKGGTVDTSSLGAGRSDGKESSAPQDQEQLLKSFDDSMKQEEKEITLKNEELDMTEESVTEDEFFVDFFTKAKAGKGGSGTSSNNTCTGQQKAKLCVFNLYLCTGEIMTVKSSTLCIYENSKLAQDFNDDEWIHKHLIRCDDGKEVILVKYPAEAFKIIIDRLRLRSIMMKHHDKKLPIVSKYEIVKGLASRLFPDTKDFMSLRIDSQIVTCGAEQNHIMTWLGEVNKTSDPELLYSASRDGWRTSDFHSKCDSKGATITIVKTSEGCVFGGYSDQSWYSSCSGAYTSSNDAFLFSLKSFVCLASTKMKLKSAPNGHAIYSHSSSGPCFGRGHDLCIGYSGNNMRVGCTYGNSAYEVPRGSSKYFLAEEKSCFQAVDVEVFKV